ncbi:uncharacterized protein A4U43_C09F11210 [Asparagus officinalis]|uniref:Surfeit locus protein 2 n=1 Tax=Asparagus officinalis TaxID=4686 RepID=A0A5P1E6S7_ASPOF|nr:surfeit locus protein 2-like [Asparagus officinalis]ONK58341.1 uncharacterized protein A4U43_C09F11210 [Asparagus officinalis]
MEVDEGANQNPNPTKSSTENGTSGKKNKKKENKEGSFLLGSPTFTELGNGRFKCNETGHELPAKEKEPYGRSKACRVALIDAAVASKKPPLNTFQQCPLSKSKLVCELTGDTINKSEEHIWKHITGKRFQNKLEQKELEKMASPERVEKNSKKSKKLHKSSMEAIEEDQEIKPDGKGSLEGNDEEGNSDIEEPDFWIPPAGERWDFDDGKDRWEDSMTPDHHDEDDGLG